MEIRKFETDHSIWLIDEDLKRFLRLPKDENIGSHPELAYAGSWEDYEYLVETPNLVDGGIDIMVKRASDGHRIRTYIPTTEVLLRRY